MLGPRVGVRSGCEKFSSKMSVFLGSADTVCGASGSSSRTAWRRGDEKDLSGVVSGERMVLFVVLLKERRFNGAGRSGVLGGYSRGEEGIELLERIDSAAGSLPFLTRVGSSGNPDSCDC